jgi:hypothetical protein
MLKQSIIIESTGFREEKGWLTDSRNNKASIEYFGGLEKAEAALKTLKDCDGCINCLDCVDCVNCSYCVDCFDCVDCVDCFDCVDLCYKTSVIDVKTGKRYNA